MLARFNNQTLSMETPTVLFEEGDYAIYWLGILERSAFRSNVYLIKEGEKGIIVDPGHRAYFEVIKKRVEQIMDTKNVQGLIICHQDPDVAASMVDWIDLNPDIKIMTSPRTHVLLPYYGKAHYNAYDVVTDNQWGSLTFIESPFLHFPGAFTTYCTKSKFLFSGDIWAAIDMEWELVVENFENHQSGMSLFHLDYMSSNIACRGYIEKIEDLEIEAILPQHGSIIPKQYVKDALEYLKNIQCGTDLIYPHLSF